MRKLVHETVVRKGPVGFSTDKESGCETKRTGVPIRSGTPKAKREVLGKKEVGLMK